jgi:hypothetical protein
MRKRKERENEGMVRRREEGRRGCKETREDQRKPEEPFQSDSSRGNQR